jgi:hypothetical protein
LESFRKLVDNDTKTIVTNEAVLMFCSHFFTLCPISKNQQRQGAISV